MAEGLSSGAEFANWKAPTTKETEDKTSEYLGELKVKSEGARLDRSEIFRYPKDNVLLTQEFKERVARGDKSNILIIGIGNLEEPMSYLAMAQRAGREKGVVLDQTTDMSLVDIRPKEEIKLQLGLGKVLENSSGIRVGSAFAIALSESNFQEKPRQPKPEFADVFEYNSNTTEYEFNDEIKNSIQQTLNNPKKCFLNTAVEDFVEKDQKQYDIVACNNVLQHLGGTSFYRSPFKEVGQSPENFSKFLDVAYKVINKVKPGGLLFIHTGGSVKEKNPVVENGDEALYWIPGFADNFVSVQKGVYRRKDITDRSQ